MQVDACNWQRANPGLKSAAGYLFTYPVHVSNYHHKTVCEIWAVNQPARDPSGHRRAQGNTDSRSKFFALPVIIISLTKKVLLPDLTGIRDIL